EVHPLAKTYFLQSLTKDRHQRVKFCLTKQLSGRILGKETNWNLGLSANRKTTQQVGQLFSRYGALFVTGSGWDIEVCFELHHHAVVFVEHSLRFRKACTAA